MRIFLSIIYCFMNLAGCTDSQNRSIVATTQENGVITMDSRTVVRMGRARFACEASSVGRCYYTVFDGAAEVRSFSLARAEERLVDGLPSGFTQCVTTTAGKPSPDCKYI
jgi:hypothetical protein